MLRGRIGCTTGNLPRWNAIVSRGANMPEFESELDERGLNCQLPVLRAKKALAAMQSGQVLRVQATDPGAVRDFQAFAKQTGNPLLSHAETEQVFIFLLQKK